MQGAKRLAPANAVAQLSVKDQTNGRVYGVFYFRGPPPSATHKPTPVIGTRCPARNVAVRGAENIKRMRGARQQAGIVHHSGVAALRADNLPELGLGFTATKRNLTRVPNPFPSATDGTRSHK